jgi:hypothetical protein
MTPELRNWYLSNLGIVQYVPKGEEPVTLQFNSSQVVVKSEAVSHSVNSPASRVKSQVASVLEMMEGKAVVAPAVEAVAEEIDILSSGETNSIPTPISPALNFRLVCWQPCDDMLVFNQLKPGAQPDSDQSQLLGNVFRAIGRLPHGLPSPEIIDWPMGRSGDGGDESTVGARAMLSVFLDARIKKYGVLWVLLMGEQAAELLSPTDNSYSNLLGKSQEIAGGAKIVVIPSLQEMLQNSGAKLEAWQAIQCLINKN